MAKKQITEWNHEYKINLTHEVVKVKEIKEKEFGIIFHNKKYELTDGTSIIASLDDYDQVLIVNE